MIIAALALLAYAQEDLDPDRLEFAVIPAINYDSDLGLGVGAVLVLARFDPNYAPYRWRLEVLALTALKIEDDSLELPFHNDYVGLDLPGLAGGVLRLNLLATFLRLSNAGWYGLGSESTVSPDAIHRYHQYERTYPGVRGVARYALFDEEGKLELFGGMELTRSWISLHPGSLLERDAARASAPVTADDHVLADLLHGTRDHWLLVLLLGLVWDSRDHETVPSTGTFHELSMRASPGLDERLSYAGFTASTTWHWPLLGPELVLAGRLVGDILIGSPPLYALSNFGALRPANGPGGSTSTRGVLLQRFHGKIKLLGNVEVRARLLPFELWEQRFELGAAAFSDAGRVWADEKGRTLDGLPLDGPFQNIQVGVGGGVRLRWGETLIIRGEMGFSPTDGTSSLYIDINQAF